MNLLKLYHNINEGFDFQDIADEFNEHQDELENNNGLDTDLNNNIDITFSSFEDLVEETGHYLYKNEGIFYNRLCGLNFNLYQHYQKKVVGLYLYGRSPVDGRIFVRIDISSFKKKNGNFIEKIFSFIYIDETQIFLGYITSELVERVIPLLNKIGECSIIKNYAKTEEIDNSNKQYSIILNLDSNKLTKISISNWKKFIDTIKQYIIEINEKGLFINEGFDFQGIADEFNNKQDELENNNGLDTDLDSDDIQHFSDNEEYIIFINNFLKNNYIFSEISKSEADEISKKYNYKRYKDSGCNFTDAIIRGEDSMLIAKQLLGKYLHTYFNNYDVFIYNYNFSGNKTIHFSSVRFMISEEEFSIMFKKLNSKECADIEEIIKPYSDNLYFSKETTLIGTGDDIFINNRFDKKTNYKILIKKLMEYTKQIILNKKF